MGRRTDQALLQLIGAARARLIIVSFAVYKVPEVAAALIACAQRGCNVAVIVESEAESGGKVTFEMPKALGARWLSTRGYTRGPNDFVRMWVTGSRPRFTRNAPSPIESAYWSRAPT